MEIIIKTKNIELTPSIEAYINEKAGKLDKFLPVSAVEVFVEIEKETNHHKKGDIFSTEIIVELEGKKLVAKCHGEDLMKTVLEAKDQMELEVKKYKAKRIEEPRRQAKKSEENVNF